VDVQEGGTGTGLSIPVPFISCVTLSQSLVSLSLKFTTCTVSPSTASLRNRKNESRQTESLHKLQRAVSPWDLSPLLKGEHFDGKVCLTPPQGLAHGV
jgi:hypothetical protein